jgi:hypothetical protein
VADLRSPTSTSRFAVIVLYVALTLVYAWPLLPVIGSALPNDTGDPGLNAWILWWNAHAVPLSTAWWNAPLFVPARGAMALSESFLHLVPLSTPLQWLGASAVLTYNLMFLLSFPAAAFAAHALVRHVTGRDDAALIAGLAFGFAPYRAAQMPHLQTLWSCWMPFALLALHAFVTTKRARWLVLFGVSWLLNGLATGYFLFFFSILVGLWLLWFARSWREWLAIGATAATASLPLVPLLLGYQHYQDAFGLSRGVKEIETFSADLTAVWATSSYVLPRFWTIDPRPEGELYPGAVVLALAIAGVVVAWFQMTRARRYRTQRWLLGAAGLLVALAVWSVRTGGHVVRFLGITLSLTRPAKAVSIAMIASIAALAWNPRIVVAWRRRSPLFFYVTAAAIMLFLALGPVAHIGGRAVLDPAPYSWLMQLPGGHAFRVPARFAMLFVLCLSASAGVAFARLTPGGAARPIVAAVALAVALEGWVFAMGVAPVPRRLDLAGLDRGAVLLELPLVDDYSDTAAMLRATEMGHALVNGFSGYFPPHYELLKNGLQNLDPGVVGALQQFTALLVFVHQDTDPDHHYKDFIESIPDARRVLATQAGTLYQLPRRAGFELSSTDRSLPPVSLAAEGGPPPGSFVTDGDLTTRWETRMHQSPGNQVTIDMGRDVTVHGLELDLGQFREDYPRKLRVTVSTGDGRSVKVWEGNTLGLAMAAMIVDRARMPLFVPLPPDTRARQIVLTVVEGHPEFSWSIAELKVLGPG